MVANRRQNFKGNTNNSMTTSRDKLFYAWRPNNFRRQIKIKTLLNSGVKKILSTIPNATQNNHTKIISIKDYCDNITVQVFKEAVTFIWKQERHRNIKKWYSISGDNLAEIQGKIRHHKTEITKLLDSAAEMFKQQTGLEYLGVFKWTRYEDALKGDSFLDSLPRDAIIHAEHFKKVYADEVEFIGRTDDEPTAKMVNYIHNRVVERFTPEIAKEINKLASDLRAFNGNVVYWCQEHIQTLDDVLKYQEVIKYLPNEKRLQITDYLFNKFGGGIL
jgi:hypothetical protein